MVLTQILNKTSNINFSDLSKVFKNKHSNYTDIRISNYYKSTNTDNNNIFQEKENTNVEGKILNISENNNIPLNGKISIENFKNSKQIGILYHTYTNASVDTHIHVKQLLDDLYHNIDDYDIIKIIFKGTSINSNEILKSAINIDVSNFKNLMSLNLYLETFVTGCHGKGTSRTNASGLIGGNGESSSDASSGINISNIYHSGQRYRKTITMIARRVDTSNCFNKSVPIPNKL